MFDALKRGVPAGYLIGLSAYIYGSCENKIVGAFLFGLGLLTICTFKLNLFTGKIGEGKLGECLLIFAANALGIFIAVYLLKWLPWCIFSLAVIGNIVGAKLIAFGVVVKEVK